MSDRQGLLLHVLMVCVQCRLSLYSPPQKPACLTCAFRHTLCNCVYRVAQAAGYGCAGYGCTKCSLSIVFTMCRLPFLEQQLGVDPALLSDKLPHIGASLAIMAVPGLFAWGADIVMRLITPGSAVAAASASTSSAAAGQGPALALSGAGGGLAMGTGASPSSSRSSSPTPAAVAAAAANPTLDCTPPPFLQLSYAYLPLVWGATLAHYTQALMEEAGTILPVTAATFGLDGSGLPVLVAEHAVTQFLQGALLLGSTAFSLLLVRRLGARRWVVLAPQCLALAALTAELWYLIVR